MGYDDEDNCVCCNNFFYFFIFVSRVLAHPGNTAADGCHYCRTNCAKWGEIEDARHCHGGGTATTTTTNTYVAPTYSPKPTPIPTPIPTPKPSPTPTPTPSLSPTPEKTPEVMGVSDESGQETDSGNDDSVGGAVLGLALLGGGYGGYKWLKGKKTKDQLPSS